jgi:hypothetical protein
MRQAVQTVGLLGWLNRRQDPTTVRVTLELSNTAYPTLLKVHKNIHPAVKMCRLKSDIGGRNIGGKVFLNTINSGSVTLSEVELMCRAIHCNIYASLCLLGRKMGLRLEGISCAILTSSETHR